MRKSRGCELIHDFSIGEILDALEELSEDTRDETLRRQINERLDYEKKAFEIFIHNQTGKYVYDFSLIMTEL